MSSASRPNQRTGFAGSGFRGVATPGERPVDDHREQHEQHGVQQNWSPNKFKAKICDCLTANYGCVVNKIQVSRSFKDRFNRSIAISTPRLVHVRALPYQLADAWVICLLSIRSVQSSASRLNVCARFAKVIDCEAISVNRFRAIYRLW